MAAKMVAKYNFFLVFTCLWLKKYFCATVCCKHIYLKWPDNLMPKIIAKISMASKMAAKCNNSIDYAEKYVIFSYFDSVSLTDIVFFMFRCN